MEVPNILQDRTASYTEDMSVMKLPSRNPSESTYYIEDSDPNHQVDIYQGDSSPKPLIILFHGGYWRPRSTKDHLSPMAGALNDLGYTVLIPEYSRVPGSPNRTFEEMKEFLKMVEKDFVDNKRKIILIGHSVGAHLAIMCSTYSNKIDGLILLAPVSDLIKTEEMNLGEGAVKAFFGEPSEKRGDLKELDPMRLAVKNIPTVIIHGKEDTRLPVQFSRDYAEYVRKFDVEVKLFELDNIGHFEVINPEKKDIFQIILTEAENFNH